jgi:hypothetical protein
MVAGAAEMAASRSAADASPAKPNEPSTQAGQGFSTESHQEAGTPRSAAALKQRLKRRVQRGAKGGSRPDEIQILAAQPPVMYGAADVLSAPKAGSPTSPDQKKRRRWHRRHNCRTGTAAGAGAEARRAAPVRLSTEGRGPEYASSATLAVTLEAAMEAEWRRTLFGKAGKHRRGRRCHCASPHSGSYRGSLWGTVDASGE